MAYGVRGGPGHSRAFGRDRAGSLHGEGDAVNDRLGQPVCCYLPGMTVQISKGSHLTPRLLPRAGDYFTASLQRLLNQLIDTGFTAGGDADDAFAVAALRNLSVPHNPLKALRGNEHETEPVIELELQRFWQAVDFWLVFHASIVRLKTALTP